MMLRFSMSDDPFILGPSLDHDGGHDSADQGQDDETSDGPRQVFHTVGAEIENLAGRTDNSGADRASDRGDDAAASRKRRQDRLLRVGLSRARVHNGGVIWRRSL